MAPLCAGSGASRQLPTISMVVGEGPLRWTLPSMIAIAAIGRQLDYASVFTLGRSGRYVRAIRVISVARPARKLVAQPSDAFIPRGGSSKAAAPPKQTATTLRPCKVSLARSDFCDARSLFRSRQATRCGHPCRRLKSVEHEARRAVSRIRLVPMVYFKTTFRQEATRAAARLLPMLRSASGLAACARSVLRRALPSPPLELARLLRCAAHNAARLPPL